MGEGVYYIAATGEDAARFMRLLAASASSAGGEYLSDKFEKFVEAARVEVRLGDVKLTESGAAADLIISEGGVAVKYNVYLRGDAIELQFQSTDRSHAELAALLLKLAGVDAEVKKEDVRDEWHVRTATDMLTAGREELRNAIAEVVKTTVKNGWADAGKAEGWLKELERGAGWRRLASAMGGMR